MTTEEPDETDRTLDAAFAAIANDPDEAAELAAGLLPLTLRRAIVKQTNRLAGQDFADLADGGDRYERLLTHPACADPRVFELASRLAADPEMPLERALGSLDLIDHQPPAGSRAN